MANCKNCGANVGCGCNLVNGLCRYCQSQINKLIANDNPETNKL